MQVFLYWKEILSWIAVFIAIYSYVTYIRSIFQKKTEPHIFSWLIWTLTTGIAFFSQWAWGGWWWGMQNWVTFLVCFFVTFLAFKYWRRNRLTSLDWTSLFLSFLAIGLWLYTKNPFYGSFFATLADVIGYIPTISKVWKNPDSEPRWYYLLMNVKHILSLVWLSVYSWTTMIFSLAVVSANFLLIFIQIWRKRKNSLQ